MGQIVFNGQKPKYCNLTAITTGSKKDYLIPDGEIWLIDSTNTSKTDGTGKYDYYIKGDGSNTASQLAANKIKVDDSIDISGKADKSEMSVVAGTGANADKTTITLKSGTSATVLTQHQDVSEFLREGEVFGEGDDSTASFNPYADTVWNKQQTLSESQKQQIRENIGVSVTDSEDIQSVNGTLKFADRAYTATTSSVQGNMGYKILRKGNTFASQVTTANTIYEIRYDYDLSTDFNMPSNCVLKFNGGSVSGAYSLIGSNTKIEAGLVKIFGTDITISGTWNINEAYPEWLGAVGDGVVDDSAAFNNLVSMANNGFCGKITLQSTEYLVKNQLHFTNKLCIIGNDAILKFQGNSTFACVKVSKTTPYVKLDVGSVSCDEGGITISVDNSSEIFAGDYLIIHNSTDYSWSSERAYYHSGDIVKVESINGNIITITESLTHGYSGSSIELYKLNTIKADISNLKILGSSDDGNTNKTLTPLYVMGCIDSTFNNLELSGSNTSNLSINLSYGICVNNIKIDDNSTDITLNYGISIGACKNVIIGNSFLKSNRHAIEIGGGEAMSIPNRFIEIHDCIIDGYNSTSGCLDSHGNAEYITFRDNIIKNGIDCCASRFLIEGNKIFSRKELPYTIYLVSARYRTGAIRDNEIHWYDNANGNCGISIYTNNDADDNSVLEISGNVFYIDGQTNGVAGKRADIYFRNGTTYKYKELVIKDNTFHKEDIPNCHTFYAKLSLADKLTFEGNISNNIVELESTANIGESLITGNIFEKNDASCLVINGGGTKCNIIGNHFITNNYPVTFTNTTKNENTTFIVSDNYFDITIMQGGRASINSQKSKKTIFINNTIYSATEQNGRYLYDIVAANSPEVIVKNNKYLVNDVRLYSPTTVTTMKRDSGDTASRNYSLRGDAYFDTDLGKTIWWNGTSWVDATGTAV